MCYCLSFVLYFLAKLHLYGIHIILAFDYIVHVLYPHSLTTVYILSALPILFVQCCSTLFNIVQLCFTLFNIVQRYSTLFNIVQRCSMLSTLFKKNKQNMKDHFSASQNGLRAHSCFSLTSIRRIFSVACRWLLTPIDAHRRPSTTVDSRIYRPRSEDCF